MAELEQDIREGATPRLVWWSLVAGFAAWGIDLALSYILEQHTCSTGHHYVLHLISIVCVLIALSGFVLGYQDFKKFPPETNDHGGRRYDRAHFQALLGMAFSLAFTVVIIAGAIPRWILSPCD